MKLQNIFLSTCLILFFSTISFANTECPANSGEYCTDSNNQYCCGNEDSGYYCAQDVNHCTR